MPALSLLACLCVCVCVCYSAGVLRFFALLYLRHVHDMVIALLCFVGTMTMLWVHNTSLLQLDRQYAASSMLA